MVPTISSLYKRRNLSKMKNIQYRYTNNGEFPIRSIKTRGRSIGENTYLQRNDQNGEIEQINLNKNSLSNLNQGFKTSGVSEATRRKIAKHCRVLSLASAPRTVRNSAGKYVPHLLTFITLSLPSEQQHDDAQITKVILGKFLDKARKIGLLTNYVWRAEKQKNGNIHYHLLTDTFANFSLFQRLWLLACRELDYLENYTKKFSEMDFKTYQKQSFNTGKSFSDISSAYLNGVRNKWRTPPACHVTFVTDSNGVSKYVSKYISKADPDNPNIVTGRTWGASQSVSKSVQTFCTDNDFSKDWYNAGAEIMRRKLIATDFYSICLFKVTSLQAWFQETKLTILNLLRRAFTPCEYWRNSVGFIPI